MGEKVFYGVIWIIQTREGIQMISDNVKRGKKRNGEISLNLFSFQKTLNF